MASSFRRGGVVVAAVLAASAAALAQDDDLQLLKPPPPPPIPLTQSPAGEYLLDRRHSSITNKIDHMGLSMTVSSFETFDAKYTYDPKRPEASKISVTIDPASIHTGIADGELDRELQKPAYFDVAKYPTITFVSTKVVPDRSGKTGKVYGDLTFHGHTRPIVMDVKYNRALRNVSGVYTMGFSAKTVIDRAQFGWLINEMLGQNVTVEIESEFTLGADVHRSWSLPQFDPSTPPKP